jgi:signal transduction histidine kinase
MSAVLKFPLSPAADESRHAAAHRHVNSDFLVAPAQPSHFVQFYEEEESLFDMVGQFLGAGLSAGDRLLVIATPEHHKSFMQRLGPPGAQAVQSGMITLLDARETLSNFMVDGAPDPARFRSLLSQVVARTKAKSPHASLRAYGEMVDLLWREGNSDAAIRLEELWNDAGQEHTFSLFCAYTVGNFYKEGDGARFFDVCRNHTHIVPTESFGRQRALEKEIAHRKDLEDALRAALRKRTQAEEELRACLRREQGARAQAEEAAAFRELFVGMLGHDLRNPLNTILNTARVVMMRGEVAPEGERRLERLVASATRMQRMIEQLLDLTRARLAGGIPIARSWQDLDPLVSRIVAETRGANPAREIAYRKQGDCWASVDTDRFEQVVANLVGNAITHGSAAKPISITLWGSALAVQLSVHNDGQPIDSKFLPCLFDPFARTEKTPGRSEGLGLGLYIVDRIIKAHDGIIDASSSTETGTTFEATVPKHERSSRG